MGVDPFFAHVDAFFGAMGDITFMIIVAVFVLIILVCLFKTLTSGEQRNHDIVHERQHAAAHHTKPTGEFHYAETEPWNDRQYLVKYHRKTNLWGWACVAVLVVFLVWLALFAFVWHGGDVVANMGWWLTGMLLVAAIFAAWSLNSKGAQ